jgi:hypothetical protein
MRNVFTVIVRDVRFYVLLEHIHVLSSLALQSSCYQINIVLLINVVRTLANVVIIDLT